MILGDIVHLNLPGPAGEERFRVMAVLGATQLERGPLLLRLKSRITGRTIYDFPSSQVTKEESA